ncbi:MAG: hypothetical protein C3F02_03460 [Parcubacteria group bacterium]|nr:MAG: hypothetical protein C3F02_03460 [Parcubacteria group bacterium]
MKALSYIFLLIVIVIGVFIWKTQWQQTNQIVNNFALDNTIVNSANTLGNFVKNIKIPLTKLDLSHRGLNQVPMDTFDQIQIQELDLSDNNLTGAIPAEVRHLSNLEILNLSNNQLTGVPAEVGQLSRLRILDLANNKLTGLPYELGNLKKLEVLNLSGNNYATADLDIIKKGLPGTVQIIY